MNQIRQFRRLGKFTPRNVFYNLTPVNQGRVALGLKPKRGRPATLEEFGNSLLNNFFFMQALGTMLKPLHIFQITDIGVAVGTSRYKITPTNAWRRLLLGESAVRAGRPSHGTRLANTALRAAGAPDPRTAAVNFTWYLIGMTITWMFTKDRMLGRETGEEKPQPVQVDDEEDSVAVISASSQEVNEASLSVYVMCDHDQCTESAHILKCELADHVHVDGADRLVWFCMETRAIQPCKIIDLQMASVSIDVRYRE